MKTRLIGLAKRLARPELRWFTLGLITAVALLSRGGSPLRAQGDSFPVMRLPFYKSGGGNLDGTPLQFDFTPQGMLAVGYGSPNAANGQCSTSLRYIIVYTHTGIPVSGYTFDGDPKRADMSYSQMNKRAPRY